MRKKKKAKRTYTPEQLEVMRARMAKARAAIKTNLGGGNNGLRGTQETAEGMMGGNARTAEQSVPDSDSAAQDSPPEALKLSAFGTVPSCGSPAQRKMLVHKLVQNDRMLIARDIGTELDRHVWVGDNHNFVPGMPLNAVPHPAEPAFWKLVGSLPQSKGRW